MAEQTAAGRPEDARPDDSLHHEAESGRSVPHPYDASEWRRRLAEQLAATQARRAAQKAARAELAARRAAGLQQRHGGKLRRQSGRRR